LQTLGIRHPNKDLAIVELGQTAKMTDKEQQFFRKIGNLGNHSQLGLGTVLEKFNTCPI